VVADATQLPGDTLWYTVYYDNDGSAATEDTATIIDVLPNGVAFLDTTAMKIDAGGVARGGGDRMWAFYRYDATWQNYQSTDLDSLLLINAVQFRIPQGIGLHDTVGEAGSGTVQGLIADGDSLDSDAGYIKFMVRIR